MYSDNLFESYSIFFENHTRNEEITYSDLRLNFDTAKTICGHLTSDIGHSDMIFKFSSKKDLIEATDLIWGKCSELCYRVEL